jgi:hypothetical protein
MLHEKYVVAALLLRLSTFKSFCVSCDKKAPAGIVEREEVISRHVSAATDSEATIDGSVFSMPAESLPAYGE